MAADSPPTLWQAISVGDYYRLRKKSGDFKENQIVVVTEVRERDGKRSIEVKDGSDTTWTCDEDEFADMERLSDGPKALQDQIDLAIEGMTSLEATSGEIRVALSNVSPHLDLPAGEISEKSLVPAIRDLAQTRQKMASARNTIAKLNLEMKKRQADAKQLITLQKQRMQAMFRAQSELLAGKLGDLNKLLAAAEEAIWTINLYLGKDETIVQVAKGKPAPKDTQISIRQLVLYADEECAIAAEEGGIDSQDLKAFDKWVAVPAHRRQVLPEAKGVVAFKVRRKSKRRDEEVPAWANAEMDKKDKKTYFLMANGENLYRICTELEVGDHIIPVENEHSDLFFTSDFDYDTRTYKKEPIYPGDARYMEVMEKASELKKHYLRILLFLQGLLDRTAVFAPLPAPRLNLLNRAVYNNDHLAFITDAEKLLTTGRPSFTDWLKSINGKLDVGHRIMGTFSSYESGLREYRRERIGGNDRLSPPNATYPDDLKLYTIQKHETHGWFFLYDRDETIYRHRRGRAWNRPRPQDGPAQRRASCEIKSSDTFILNFDMTDVASMEWYLGNRTDRHSYAQMFPLLKAAIQIKHEEAKQEAPFRDLLAREILKAHQVTLTDAQAATEDLVSWWKFKNKEHRALLTDDAKALRMIVKEFGARQIRAAERSGLDSEAQTVARILAAWPSAVCIAHKKGKTFVALVPEVNLHEPGLDDNVYVCEQEWLLKDADPELLSEARWSLVERKRLMMWKVLYRSDRWEGWKIDAREAEHLTRPERDDLIKAAKVSWATSPMATMATTAICISHDHEYEEERSVFKFWFWSSEGKVPGFFLSGVWRPPEIETVSVFWSKKKGVVTPLLSDRSSHSYPLSRAIPFPTGLKSLIVEQDRSAIATLNENRERYFEALQVRDALTEIVNGLVDQAREAMAAAILEQKKAEFLREYEHEDLWEDHKKSYTQRDLMPPHPDRIRAAVSHLIERRYHSTKQVPSLESFNGLTYGELLKQAAALGWKPKDDHEDRDHVPVAAIINFEKPQEEEKAS